MWAIITFAVCFMLACVMLISGSGNIGETKNAIEDTIVKQEIESSFKKRAISYYGYAQDGLMNFDRFYAQKRNYQAPLRHGSGNAPGENIRPPWQRGRRKCRRKPFGRKSSMR